jgi:uncharacterized protein (DUF433 family)
MPDWEGDAWLSASVVHASAKTSRPSGEEAPEYHWGYPEENQMTWQERIVVDPQILVGKPVIRGTRLAVELIVDLLGQGWSEEEILKNYPGLTREDLQACLK